MAQGTAEEIKQVKGSITGDYLSGRKQIHVPSKRRKGNKKCIEVVGATENNLKNISVKFPLGVFTCVTGVSGSGKSTLVNEVLYKNIAQQLNGASEKPGKCKQIKGLDNIDKIINIDQSPIGRTPRSNPATYTGAFDLIRDIFAGTNEAKMRGYEKVDSALMYQEEDVKVVMETVFIKLKCISCLMYMCHVKYVKEKDIIERL